MWDLITHINGKKISNASELKNLIGMLSPREKVTVKFIRDKQERVTQITLAELPDSKSNASNASPNTQGKNNQMEGLSVSELDATQRQRYRIPSQINGVIVTRVEKDSKAQKAGFEVGDIIAQVENLHIRKPIDLQNAFTRFKDKNKRILVYSSNGTKTIVLK